MENNLNNQGVKTSPRDVFMHLFTIILLYVSAVSFITLLFQYINAVFPDIIHPFFEQSAIRWALASLIVIFPVFLWASRFLRRDLAANPEKAELRIRKWLLYFTLFAAAGFIIGDLIALIFRFLEGELTTRFILKIVVILAVAIAVFWYYLGELKRKTGAFSPNAKTFVWFVIGAVFAAIVAGFFVAGSPFRQRLIRFDQRKVDDLINLQYQIVNSYWVPKERLPQSLDDLRDNISGFAPPRDPETGESYDYRVLGPLSFELCATFNLPSEKVRESFPEPAVPRGEFPVKETKETWEHGAGPECFERTIDPEIYKPKGSQYP